MADAASFLEAAKKGDVKASIYFILQFVSVGMLNSGAELVLSG